VLVLSVLQIIWPTASPWKLLQFIFLISSQLNSAMISSLLLLSIPSQTLCFKSWNIPILPSIPAALVSSGYRSESLLCFSVEDVSREAFWCPFYLVGNPCSVAPDLCIIALGTSSLKWFSSNSSSSPSTTKKESFWLVTLYSFYVSLSIVNCLGYVRQNTQHWNWRTIFYFRLLMLFVVKKRSSWCSWAQDR